MSKFEQDDDNSEEVASMLPIVKRRKGCQQSPEESKDEQAISESSLNKLVGAEEIYNLEVEQFDRLSITFTIWCKVCMIWKVTKCFFLIPPVIF